MKTEIRPQAPLGDLGVRGTAGDEQGLEHGRSSSRRMDSEFYSKLHGEFSKGFKAELRFLSNIIKDYFGC